jgi:hypothetical protein
MSDPFFVGSITQVEFPVLLFKTLTGALGILICDMLCDLCMSLHLVSVTCIRCDVKRFLEEESDDLGKTAVG